MNTSIYFLAIRLPACNKVSSGLAIPLHVIGNGKLKDHKGFGAEEVSRESEIWRGLRLSPKKVFCTAGHGPFRQILTYTQNLKTGLALIVC